MSCVSLSAGRVWECLSSWVQRPSRCSGLCSRGTLATDWVSFISGTWLSQRAACYEFSFSFFTQELGSFSLRGSLMFRFCDALTQNPSLALIYSYIWGIVLPRVGTLIGFMQMLMYHSQDLVLTVQRRSNDTVSTPPSTGMWAYSNLCTLKDHNGGVFRDILHSVVWWE